MINEDRSLDAFFSPRGVAVIGASRDETKLGFGVVRNLLACGYRGGIYPVNPRTPEILGLRSYGSVLEVPDPVDLAVVIVPVGLTLRVVEDCGRRGLRGAIIITGGFRESSEDGARIEQQVAQVARRYGLRIMGPNCIGVIDTVTPLDTSFVAMPEAGNIGFFSHSGAICGGLINWTRGRLMGFSRFVSLGNQADVNETDVLEFLGNDPHTTTIAAYVEGITDGPRFMSVARQVTARKPVIALKVGTTGDGSRAVSSHTGALAGSEEAYDAAFRQTGILRAETIEDLLDWAHGLSTQPAPAGDGMAVLTNAGGPGVLAVDALQRAGLHLASLSQQTVGALRERFPPEATLTNPVDLLAAADAQGYADALALLLRDENVAGAVVLHVPHVLVRAPEVLDAIGRTAQGLGKPVVVSLFGDYAGTPELAALRGRGLPHFPSPERASRTMGAMRRYRRWQDRPASRPEELADVDRGAAAAVLRGVRREARVGLGDVETRRLLQAYGISVPPSALATDPASAVHAADEIGYPVAVKIASPDILHKTDAGGVALDLQNADAVSRAYQTVTERCLAHSPRATIWGVQVQKMMPRGREVIVGVNRDRQFGPLLMFGLGGVYVEALRDVSFRVIPITRRDAEDMIAETRAYRVLQGLRGEAPADLEAIVACLLRVSRLLEDFPQIAELDINPLVAYEQGRGVVALDARAVMEPNEDHGLEPGDDREGQQGCDNRRYGDGADNSVGPGPARGSARALLPTA